MLPIKSNKLVLTSLLSTIFVPFILYFLYTGIIFIISGSEDFFTIFFAYVYGPIFIILCAIIIHLCYFLFIKNYDFNKPGSGSFAYIPSFFAILGLTIINYLLFEILNSLNLDPRVFLGIVTLVNLIFIYILFGLTCNEFERSDIRG